MFNDENMKEVSQSFARKQALVIGTCILILILSQTGFELSTKLLTNEGDTDIKKVIHLTTALFLLLLGSFLEFSKKSDLIILFISLVTFVGKVNNGFVLR